MQLRSFSMGKLITIAVVIIIMLPLLVVYIRYFESLDVEGTTLGFDWMPTLYTTVEGGVLSYTRGHTPRYPPWGLVWASPLGLLSPQGSWGLLALLYVIVLMLSLPRPPRRFGLYIVLALVTLLSYPALRTIADGNLELLALAGTLLLLTGYRRQNPLLLAVGALMATAKPQVTMLLAVVAGVYAIGHWPRRDWLLAAGTAGFVVGVTLWFEGQAWAAGLTTMRAQGSIMDSSLVSSAARTGVIAPWLANGLRAALVVASLWLCYLTRWTLSREKAGMLMAAALLIAPYAGGNSALSIYAIGVIPFFIKRPVLGGVLIALTNLPYLFLGNTDLQFNYSAYYWTLYFFVVWAVLGWHVYRTERYVPQREDAPAGVSGQVAGASAS